LQLLVDKVSRWIHLGRGGYWTRVVAWSWPSLPCQQFRCISPWRSPSHPGRSKLSWCGTEVASGGHCIVAWVNVSYLTWVSGLGLSDLRTFDTTLLLQWLCLDHTDPNRTWASFRFPMVRASQAFFNASITIEVWDCAWALFWEDAWIAGCSIKTLAPQPVGRHLTNDQMISHR
jgi:hypothetical protein